MKRSTWLSIVATATLGAGLATHLASAAVEGPGAAPGQGHDMHGGPGGPGGPGEGPGRGGRWEHGPGRGMDGGMGMMGMPNPRMLERIAGELGLSDAQRQKIKGLLEAARPGMQQLRERGRQNAERLRAAKPGDKSYDVTVAEVSREAGELMSQMVRDASKVRAQVWAEFTPEQRTKLDAMQQKMHARMQERMQEHREKMRQRHDAPPPPPPPGA